ncbi:MAG TPA: beta-L-arabinofuranosidase domain-containing protein [Sedimentisphaerales bacterium]|nr:beta-L-arabinofuranosidase domain-containing protein [Sedimentisphaerales bacterium]
MTNLSTGTNVKTGNPCRYLIVAGLLCVVFGLSPASVALAGCPLKPVSFTAVKIEDKFWSPKLTAYRTNTIPHSWPHIEDNIKAMRKLAGLADEPCKTGLWTEANLYKFVETIAYSLPRHPDAELEKRLDEVIAAIAAAQSPDGYLHAHVTLNNLTPWGNLYHQHDGYVAGHLYEAAVAHFQATGKRTFLDVACKSADQACRHFLDQNNPGFGGHAEIELALVELYRATGRKRYLELAQAFIKRRGQVPEKECPRFPCEYFQDHLPIRGQNEIRGHAVRAVFFATGVADVAIETGDPDMRAAAERLWDSTTKRKMYLTGSIGASKKHEAFADDYVLPNNSYCESCAACGLADFAHRMLLLEADAQCADVLERVLYNAILHGISLDGKSFYYRNPLHDADHPRGNNWCCCPPNLSRTLMKLPKYIYARDDRDIYVNLYVGGAAAIALSNNTITLTQQTDYPWDGKVKIRVNPQEASRFSVNLRIPGWCQKARLALNGSEFKNFTINKGYARMDHEWEINDTIELDLAMPVERIEAHPNVKDNTGLAAIQRGPIVYGLEALDNSEDLDITLAIDPQFETEHRREFLGGVTVIKGKSAQGTKFAAIPFYALANRGNSTQVVWLPQKGKKETLAGWQDKLYRELDPSTLTE